MWWSKFQRWNHQKIEQDVHICFLALRVECILLGWWSNTPTNYETQLPFLVNQHKGTQPIANIHEPRSKLPAKIDRTHIVVVFPQLVSNSVQLNQLLYTEIMTNLHSTIKMSQQLSLSWISPVSFAIFRNLCKCLVHVIHETTSSNRTIKYWMSNAKPYSKPSCNLFLAAFK